MYDRRSRPRSSSPWRSSRATASSASGAMSGASIGSPVRTTWAIRSVASGSSGYSSSNCRTSDDLGGIDVGDRERAQHAIGVEQVDRAPVGDPRAPPDRPGGGSSARSRSDPARSWPASARKRWFSRLRASRSESSMSVLVPTQPLTRPSPSRLGTARIWNQWYSPSCRRRRTCVVHGPSVADRGRPALRQPRPPRPDGRGSSAIEAPRRRITSRVLGPSAVGVRIRPAASVARR